MYINMYKSQKATLNKEHKLYKASEKWDNLYIILIVWKNTI